jgi:hypothetical protein
LPADDTVGVVPTHYEILGIPEGASEEQVRHAYRRLVKAAHPDRAGDAAEFRRVTRAYTVLSDPAERAAYDRSLRPALVAAPPVRRRRYGRYAVLLVTALAVGSVAWLVVATTRQSVGDECLVGTWRGEPFEVAFRGVLDGREVTAPIRGGAGVTLRVAADGIVRTDYAEAAPLAGADGAYRIEGVYVGTAIERWRAADGRVKQDATDASDLRFQAMINARPTDQPLAVTVVDREYPYACTATTLELGPYRYMRH